MKIRILDEAQLDLDVAAQFYEKQKLGLGVYFLDSLFSDIESLVLYSGIHRKVYGYFRLLSKNFPYAIYYLVSENTIDIYAVLDCRQNPQSVIKKLK